MSPVDVEAVNERLNGLVTLLKAVGVDSFGEGTATDNYNENSGNMKRSGIPDARQLDDDQIAAIIKKLQMAQSEAPQIIAALEAQAKMKRQQHQQPTPSRQQEVKDVDDGDDDEDEDSYDDDANYPMVGPGCSDDVSVVSDLTTPTVVQNPHVPDEEHYRSDSLPPMLIIGGNGPNQQQHPPMLIAPTKRKNLVGSVRANTLATAPRSGAGVSNKGPAAQKGNGTSFGGPTTPGSNSGSKGAAAQRRKLYNATMERLTNEGSMPSPPTTQDVMAYPLSPARSSGSNGNVSHPIQPRKVKAPTSNPQQQQPQRPVGYENNMTPAAAPPDVRKKVNRRASLSNGQVPPPRSSASDDWNVPPGWNAFENTSLKQSQSRPIRNDGPATSSYIDDDGFLMSPSTNFDPFMQQAPMTSSKPSMKTPSSSSRKYTDAKSIGSGSRRSNGSDPKSDSQQRRIKKPSSNAPVQQPMKPLPSFTNTGNKNMNPHFIDQPPMQHQQPMIRSRPQQQHSMTMEQPMSQQSQTNKVRRSRRASLGM